MIDVSNRGLYAEALRQLKAYKAGIRNHRGRFIQIFLGLKYFQNQLPSMFSNQFVRTETLQQLLDDLYAKNSRPATACVLMLFQSNYLARTGLRGANTSAQNTWRNNFNIQKGIGCYAAAQDLASPTFLNASRLQCRHLVQNVEGSLEGAHCELSSAGSYRRDDHRKWLQIDPEGSGYSMVDMSNTSNFAPDVAPQGHRIPIFPLMAALYHDASPGLNIGSRPRVDVADFASDFNFSGTEMAVYFDQAITNRFNALLLNEFPESSYSEMPATPPPPAVAVAGGRTIEYPARRRKSASPAFPQPVLSGTPAPPPGSNSGWEAEQYVQSVLSAAGWTVHDVSRQRLGFDLLIQSGSRTRYIDVKSSLSACTPTLTAREWQVAQAKGSEYFLAVVENFDPTGENVIYWVPDPARVGSQPVLIAQYSVSRAWWTINTVPLAALRGTV